MATTGSCEQQPTGTGLNAFNVSYSYDPIGNITAASGNGTVNGSYSYTSPKPHAVTKAGDRSFTYDNVGNMKTRPTQTLTYDVQNRLAGIGDTIANRDLQTSLYDAGGNRVVRKLDVDNGARGRDLRTTVYLGSYEEDLDGTTVAESRVPHTSGRTMAGLTITTGTTVELRLTAIDHLGSGSVVTDDQGGAATVQRYTPFGMIRETGTNQLGFDQTFTGQTGDPGTGLIDYNARHYDPQLGRFIMADPVLDGLNRYSYVRNNPLRYTDPSGLVCAGTTSGGISYGCSSDDIHY